MSTAADYVDFLTPKKANHTAPIVRIKGTLPIEGADRIEQVVVEGYEAFSFVSQKGQFRPSDLAVFIQPDSVVPARSNFAYLWANGADPEGIRYGFDLKNVPASQRRITVRRYKKVWSEGLLVPLAECLGMVATEWHPSVEMDPGYVGTDMSAMLGITHYEPEVDVVGQGGARAQDAAFVPKRKRRWPRSLRGWISMAWNYFTLNEKFLEGPAVHLPVYDVENFKNYSRTFVEGERVWVTEKIHGSNARFVVIDGVLYAGSRKQWVDPKGNSYPAEALKANPDIEAWLRANPGFALYGEVTPRQKGFDYGTKKATLFVFDILTPGGEWVDKGCDEFLSLPPSVQLVPMLYAGGYDKAIIDKLVDGKSAVLGASHIREGIVITSREDKIVRGLGRAHLKIVSNAFLEKDTKLTRE